MTHVRAASVPSAALLGGWSPRDLVPHYECLTCHAGPDEPCRPDCYYCPLPASTTVRQSTANKRTLAMEERTLDVCSSCAPRVPTLLFLTLADERELHALLPVSEGP